jgi:hypothetical protein
VQYFTLRHRVQGLTCLTAHCKQARGQQQLLTDAEEGTLVDWIRYLALTGHPLNKRTIRPKVQAILSSKGIKNVNRYTQPQQSASCAQMHLSTPVNQFQATTSPCSHTCSKHNEDSVLITQEGAELYSRPARCCRNPRYASTARVRSVEAPLQ